MGLAKEIRQLPEAQERAKAKVEGIFEDNREGSAVIKWLKGLFPKSSRKPIRDTWVEEANARPQDE
ncbi:MAG: hypothetical protein WCG44_04445 [bacterium]